METLTVIVVILTSLICAVIIVGTPLAFVAHYKKIEFISAMMNGVFKVFKMFSSISLWASFILFMRVDGKIIIFMFILNGVLLALLFLIPKFYESGSKH